MTDRAVEVVRAGALTTVQDLGRPGYAHLGVTGSGALDRASHRLANRLAGNPDDTATLETTLNGCAVRVAGDTTVVVTGAPCPVTVDDRPAPWGAPVRVPAGSVVAAGTATHGLRSYLAFSGGVAVEPVLGSRSTDLLSGLGPAPLTDGTVLPLGPPSGPPVHTPMAVCPGPPRSLVLPMLLGPRDDWFTPAALRTLAGSTYRVSTSSNRIGLRVQGAPLERAGCGELPSEGMVAGAVQVPPDGLPVVFLADHPTTGGYPVIGIVPEEALSSAAQAAPGTALRFTPVRPRRPLVPGPR